MFVSFTYFCCFFPCTFPCHPVSNSKIDPSWLRLLRGLDGYMRSKLAWSFVFVPWSLHSHIGWKDRKNKGMFMLHAIHWQWKMMFITVHMMFMFFLFFFEHVPSVNIRYIIVHCHWAMSSSAPGLQLLSRGGRHGRWSHGMWGGQRDGDESLHPGGNRNRVSLPW